MSLLVVGLVVVVLAVAAYKFVPGLSGKVAAKEESLKGDVKTGVSQVEKKV